MADSQPVTTESPQRLTWMDGLLLIGVLIAVMSVALHVIRRGRTSALAPPSAANRLSPAFTLARQQGMVALPDGLFRMGWDAGPAASRPAHDVRVDGFWIDEHEVTNAQFSAFVEATRYITTAEQRGEGWVWDSGRGEPRMVRGAQWRHPSGPPSGISNRDAYPVVQVSWFDAVAYARWAKKRLPREREWEYAARGGLRATPRSSPTGCNYWQDSEPNDPFQQLAPVGRFPANRFGLLDALGNVREWCQDSYRVDAYQHPDVESAEAPGRRVVRGGSWASRFPPTEWLRDALSSEHSDNQTGFRCVRVP